jgi:hypothetical protein
MTWRGKTLLREVDPGSSPGQALSRKRGEVKSYGPLWIGGIFADSEDTV